MTRRAALLAPALLATLVAAAAFSPFPAHALYDPVPDTALAAVEGEWRGTLVYRDYSRPDKQVTLPTRLFVVLLAPDELALHYVFDDGPGKTVHSYERMRFEAGAKQLSWLSGAAEKGPTRYAVVADTSEGGTRRIVFTREAEDARDAPQRFTLELGPALITLQKEQLPTGAPPLLRNRFEFRRVRG